MADNRLPTLNAKCVLLKHYDNIIAMMIHNSVRTSGGSHARHLADYIIYSYCNNIISHDSGDLFVV